MHVLYNDGEINTNVNHKIQAGQLKWRSVTGMLCNHNISLRLKEKFYITAGKLVSLYDTEKLGYEEMSFIENIAEMHIVTPHFLEI